MLVICRYNVGSRGSVHNKTRLHLNNSREAALALSPTSRKVLEHNVTVNFRSRPQVGKLAYFKHDTGHVNFGFVDLDG